MINRYDFRSFSGFKYIRSLCVVLLGLVCSFQVSAAAFPSTLSGNRFTFSGGAFDTDAIAAGASLAISGGALMASQQSTLKTAAGVAANVVVKAAPAAGAVRSVLAACFGNPLCVVATAAAAAYVANEVNFQFNSDASGVPTVQKTDPTACTVAPCYSYNANSSGFSGSYSSLSSACTAYKSTVSVANQQATTGGTIASVAGTYGTTQCIFNLTDGRQVYPIVVSRVSVAPVTSAWLPSNVSELADAIGAKSAWSDTSKLPDLVKQTVVHGQQKYGTKDNPYIVPLSVPTAITGPASVAGVPTVKTAADGSKVTKTTNTNFGYYPPAVEVTETTTETATTAAGATTTTSTTTAPATAVTETDTCALHPTSNGCRTDEFDTPDVKLPTTTKAVTFAAENLGFAGGTCPANVVQTIHGKQYTLVNWSQHCGYITTYAKPMILAAAMFAALMIIFVGGKPE